MARAAMLAVLLLGLVAAAAAQGTSEPTQAPTPTSAPTPGGTYQDPSRFMDGDDPDGTFVPGLIFTGFIVVNASGEYSGTASPPSVTKVLTNQQTTPTSNEGGDASITSADGQPFTINAFTLANPNMGTAVTITLVFTAPDGSQTQIVVTLAANAGPTPFGPYPNIIGISFLVGTQPSGRKLLGLGQQPGQAVTNQYALSGLFTTVAAVTPSGPTAPTAAPSTPTATPSTPTATPSTPTATPSTPTATPSTPTATPSRPTATPSTPTAAPTTPTTTPTRAPTSTSGFPTSCASSSQYRALGGCKNCVSRSSPFKQVYGGSLCYPPTTLSAGSTVCTNAVHPAYILSNLGAKDTIVGCINPFKSKVRLVFPIRNSNYPFVTSKVFIGSSLRLDGVIPRDGFGNGQLVYVRPGITRLEFTFTQSDTIILRRRSGLTVTVTGVWRRQGTLLDYCFVSYLKVCG